MNTFLVSILTFAALVFTTSALGQATKPDDGMNGCPMHAQHQAEGQHDQGMNHRGDEGMGFAQNKATHHFLLSKNGGVIQVNANSPEDRDSIKQIRMHLKHISHAFQSGDFNIPMFVHDQTPPGVPAMQKLKQAMSYKYEDTESGGRVVISTSDPKALKAVHEFLRFQIKEHKTGDRLELE